MDTLRNRNRESLVKETGGVTDNLTAISRQLAATVERSAMAVDELAQVYHMMMARCKTIFLILITISVFTHRH